MEGTCFSTLRKGAKHRERDSQHDRKLALGLVYPIYIITSSYNSPFLRQLQEYLQKQSITIAFQNSLQVLHKIPSTYKERYLIILNDFNNKPALSGEFETIEWETLSYPQLGLQGIVRAYNCFVERQSRRLIGTGNVINESNQQFKMSSFSKAAKQIIQSSMLQSGSTSNSKIQIRSVSRLTNNYKTGYPKKLFIYSNKHDDQQYTNYLKQLSKYNIENAVYVQQIEDYARYLPSKGEEKYCVLMSEYSALNLRMYFKRTDQILLMAQNMEKCCPLLRGKVTEIACDEQTMNKILGNSFCMKLKGEKQSKKLWLSPKDEDNQLGQQSQNIVVSAFGSDTRMSEFQQKSVINLKIYQQYSIVNDGSYIHKHLDLFSDVLQYSIAPAKQQNQGPELQHSTNKKPFSKKAQPLSSKTNEEFIKFSPLKIVQLDSISHVSLDIKQSQGSNDHQIFADILNRLRVPPSETQSQHNFGSCKESEIMSASQFLFQQNQEHSENGVSSRVSTRSNKNSRLVSKIQDYKKGNRVKPPISLITDSNRRSTLQSTN